MTAEAGPFERAIMSEAAHESQRAPTEALRAALDWSLGTQHPDGHWVGRLRSNCCMEAQWVLALHVLGMREHPLRDRMGRAILKEQREDGSWEVFFDAPAGDINATVECYAALRSLGMAPDHPALEKARAWILQAGGLSKVRVFTRYWLALIGVWDWRQTPNLPPEIVHAPSWFPFNIYRFASWARATLMPLAVLSAHRPVVPLPGGDRLDELFAEGRERFDFALPSPERWLSWEGFFSKLDRVLHGLQSLRLTPFRKAAVERVLEWIVRHQDADGVWGGIQPPWVYSLLALHVGGYGLEHPVLRQGLRALDDPRWRVDEDDATFVSASVSPVWDTLLTLQAFLDADQVEAHPDAVDRAVRWLLDREVRFRGDWARRRPRLQPGGWAFEYENLHYPDIDDTAVAMLVLARLRLHPRHRTPELERALARAERWVLGMQSRNGGWAAFDVDNDGAYLTRIPFCDFGEVLDPPSVDVTAHVVEALAALGYRAGHPAVRRALDFLRREQEADGSWFGRWGVNHVYGTGAVLPALRAIGVDRSEPWVQRGADWLVAHQNADGGWGESCTSYMDPAAVGRGPSTASQTAWALIGLAAVDRPQDRHVRSRGLSWLTEHQQGGTWDEPQYTGTGFPGYGVGLGVKVDDPVVAARLDQGVELSRAFMINYALYRHYFPMMALARLG